MNSIFDNCEILESYMSSTKKNNREIDYSAVFSEGTYIKDCSLLITDSMINECAGDANLIKQSAILEGAKIDWALKNFLKEGQDYKSLKKEVNKIIEANNLPKDQMKSKGKGFMHVCKRILQILQDACIAGGTAMTVSNISIGAKIVAAGGAVVGSGIIAGAIAGFVVGFIINRILRYCFDSAEFNAISTDAIEIIQTLKKQAKDTNDVKLAAKLNKQADDLQEALNKYSKK